MPVLPMRFRAVASICVVYFCTSRSYPLAHPLPPNFAPLIPENGIGLISIVKLCKGIYAIQNTDKTDLNPGIRRERRNRVSGPAG
jgi:hypothetical protein